MVGRPETAHAMRVAATVMAGHRPNTRVATVVTTHAPLAAVLALREASHVDDPDAALPVVRATLDAAWSALLVPSVAALDHPAPSLLQHVRSLLPGARWIVRLGPQAAVLNSSRPLLALDAQAAHDTVMYTSARSSLTPAQASVVRTWTQWTATKEAVTVDLPDAVTTIPGLPRAVQVVLIPRDVGPGLGHLTTHCDVCSGGVAGDVCGFCHTRSRTASGFPGRPTRASTARHVEGVA